LLNAVFAMAILGLISHVHLPYIYNISRLRVIVSSSLFINSSNRVDYIITDTDSIIILSSRIHGHPLILSLGHSIVSLVSPLSVYLAY
jgi:hypothetical protein